jgi:phage terminase large subunit-like protein
VFDPARVDKVIAVFTALRHVAGKWAGKPLKPDPWQIAYILAPVFGWVRYDKDSDSYVRIIRDLYVDVPRKNGKSTLAAGIAIYMACADGEHGAQVVTAATSEKQAGFVFNPIKTLAEKAPSLRRHVQAYTKKVVHPKSGSYIEVVSSVADAQHGANIHCSIVDELHVHKTADLVTTIETGRGSRTQPLSVIITTADSGKPDTIYDRKRRYIDRLAKRTIKDESSYGVVWAIDETDDPHLEANWKRANPGYGISPTRTYMVNKSKNAQNSPAELADFLRLHLGVRTKQQTRYIDMTAWDANGGLLVESDLKGRVAYGGLDLANVSDLTALSLIFPRTDGGYDALWRFWLPSEALDLLNQRTAGSAAVWVREGWLHLTPGNVTDYEFIKEQIRQDRTDYRIKSIGFDRWNASQLSVDLQNEGIEMIRVGQGFASTSAPMKELQRLILRGKSDKAPMLNHGGNPVMRWMTDNLAVTTDPAGNVKPDKAKAADKIDGWSALVNAMSEAIKGEPITESTYEKNDVRAV